MVLLCLKQFFNTDFTVWWDSHWTTYSSSALH